MVLPEDSPPLRKELFVAGQRPSRNSMPGAQV